MSYDESIQAGAAALPALPRIYDSRAFLENAEWLRRLARDLVVDEGEAEDLVHDGFRSFASAKRSVLQPRSYLAATVRFLNLKSRRAAGRRNYHEQARALEQPDTADATDDINERMEMAQIVLNQMRSLPPAQSRVLGLRYLEGHSAAEIAKRDGTTASSVRALISRGLSTLRQRMDSRFGERSAWSAVLLPWAGAPEAATVGFSDPAGSAIADQAAGHSAALTGTAGSFPLAVVLKVCLVVIPCILLATWLGSRASWTSKPGGVGYPATGSSDLALQDTTGMPAEIDSEFARGSSRKEVPQRLVNGSPEGEMSAVVAQAATEVRGRIVDAATKEPIPGIELRITREGEAGSSGEPAMVQTDSNGGFEAPGIRFPSGTVRVQAMDNESYLTLLQTNAPFPFQRDLEAQIGPTFRFLYSGAYVDRSLKLDVSPHSKARGVTKGWPTRTRPGPLPWARFDAPLQPGVTGLLLASPDECTFGYTEIHRQVGIEPLPIEVVFQVGGAVSFTTGEVALSGSGVVDLIPIDTDLGDGRRLRLRGQKGPGAENARFTHLPAGDYAWTLHAGNIKRTGEVAVEPMQVAEVRIDDLEVATSAFEVLVDATAVPDVDLGRWESLLAFEDDPTQGNQSRLSRLKDGEPGTWRWTVESLPVGRWIYMLRPEPGYEVDPQLVPVEVGMPVPTVVVRRAPKKIDVQITLIDAETQQSIPGAQGFHMDGFKGSQLASPSEGRFPPFGVHPTRPSLFLLCADGYRTKDIEFQPGRDDPALVIALDRGWRNRVLAADMATQSFLPGVSVHVDGEHIGATGPDGAFWLEGEDPPKLVELGLLNPELEVTLSPFELVGVPPADTPIGYVFLLRFQ